jgi:alkane 1-monooxygenase
MFLYSAGFLATFLFFWWPWLFLQSFGEFPWLIPFCTFVALPLLDALLGEYRQNWTDEESRWLKQQLWPRLFPLLAVPLFLMYQIVIAEYFLESENIWQRIGWVLTAGIAGGVMAINVGHELIHRTSKLEQRAGGLLLASVAYGTFKVEHVYGHHTWVATANDMTTAPKDMTIYQFWFRALTKTPFKALEIAQQRALKKGNKVHELWTLYSISVAMLGIYVFTFGGTGGIFWLCHSLVAILLLETVNYIEHYGLLLKKLETGKYEKISHVHSWNSSRIITNFVLFNLQRHSDHHAYASRTYPMLRHFNDSPQMPQGYAAMIMLSLIPRFWFSVMNKRLDHVK